MIDFLKSHSFPIFSGLWLAGIISDFNHSDTFQRVARFGKFAGNVHGIFEPTVQINIKQISKVGLRVFSLIWNKQPSHINAKYLTASTFGSQSFHKCNFENDPSTLNKGLGGSNDSFPISQPKNLNKRIFFYLFIIFILKKI